MEWNQLISCALDIGKQMHIAGAEIYRVEDCICRICRAYGALDVDVFSITSSIILTIQSPDGTRWTQTCRISRSQNDLHRLDALNRLSREMCRTCPDYETVQAKLKAVQEEPRYPAWLDFVFYAIIAGAFTAFVGGGWQDTLVSMGIGVGLQLVVRIMGFLGFNQVFTCLLASFYMSFFAILISGFSPVFTAGVIIIGNIMPLIPGISFTVSLRDMIGGDTISGIMRFLEACIVALAIAAGYLLASMVLGVTA